LTAVFEEPEIMLKYFAANELERPEEAGCSSKLENVDFTVISGFLENAFFLKKSPSDTSGNKQW
jgi:hypothetical protein